jgi:membrane protease YdiL (CAAX protease family)
MSDDLTIVSEALPIEAVPGRAADSKLRRWFYVFMVLLVSFGIFIGKSILVLQMQKGTVRAANSWRWIFSGGWTFSIVQELIGLLLLWFVLSRRRLRFEDIGLRWSVRDLGLGLILAVTAYLTYFVGHFFVHWIHQTWFSSVTGGLTAHEIYSNPPMVAIPYFLLSPFFEELIVRAYLMTEVRDLTGSWTLAAALSVAIQTSYHLHYGWEEAISLSFVFLVFSIYYAKTRRATPIILAHGIWDLFELVRLW